MDDNQAEKIANVRLGARFAQIREDAGMSQEDLAKAIREHGYKWTQTTVYNIERGARSLRVAEADAALQILKRNVADLTISEAQSLAKFAHGDVLTRWGALYEAFDALDARELRLARVLDQYVLEDELTPEEAEEFYFRLSPVIAASQWSDDKMSGWQAKRQDVKDGTFAARLLDDLIRQASYASKAFDVSDSARD